MEEVMKLCKFKVKSTGHLFPLDMLRYDQCFPARPDDIMALEDITAERDNYESNSNKEYSIVLYTIRKSPTVERWQSFGWYVTEVLMSNGGSHE